MRSSPGPCSFNPPSCIFQCFQVTQWLEWRWSKQDLGWAPRCRRIQLTSSAARPTPAGWDSTLGVFSTKFCGGLWIGCPAHVWANYETATPTTLSWRYAMIIAWIPTSTFSTDTPAPSRPSSTSIALGSCTWWRKCARCHSAKSWTSGASTRSTLSPAARPGITRKRSRWTKSSKERPRTWGRGKERSLLPRVVPKRGRNSGTSWKSQAHHLLLR